MTSFDRHTDEALALVRAATPVGDGTVLRRRLARVLALHQPVAGVDDRPRCGCCAEAFPCRTHRVVMGGAA